MGCPWPAIDRTGGDGVVVAGDVQEAGVELVGRGLDGLDVEKEDFGSSVGESIVAPVAYAELDPPGQGLGASAIPYRGCT